MKLIDFNKHFPTEAKCKQRWKEYRMQQGITCTECNHQHHYWKQDKECFECKKCGHRQSLRANTVMHGSQLPFRYWFIAIHLLSSTKKGISAAELQRQLGHKNYSPIWAMLHKLRFAMGNRDTSYKLSGIVELDEGFFDTEVPKDEKDEPTKRGRGSQKKTKVLVMAETQTSSDEPKKGQKPTKVKYLKMLVIDDLKAETIENKVTLCIEQDSTIKTDNSTSYTNLKKVVKEHIAQVIPKELIGVVLPWVHIAIGNAKRQIADIHRGIKPDYLQSYLNEFCYKFNRRYFKDDVFDRILITCVNYKNEFRYNIR